MVAAQTFNQANQANIPTIYGSVSNGTQWRFLKLEESTVTVDLMDYSLPPADQILGFLVWLGRADTKSGRTKVSVDYRGRTISNSVPAPTCDRTCNFPPCFSTTI